MDWHLLINSEQVPNAVNQDINGTGDGVINDRNAHFFLAQPMNLLAYLPIGANITRSRYNNASLTVYGNPHHWPVERSATIPDLPQIQDYRETPIALPVDEELVNEISTDGPAMGNAQVALMQWLGSPSWNRNLPPGEARLMTRATAVVAAGAEDAWTADVALTFERDLMSGVYAVVDAWCVAANALAFRIRFPTHPAYQGKQLRPGMPVQNAIGDSPNPKFRLGWGEWGRFHTRELPRLQTFSDSAGGTYEVRLDLIRLGKDERLLRTA